MKKIFILIVVPVLTACSPRIVTLSESEFNTVPAKPAGYTIIEFNTGKALFEKNCSRCHALKNPASRSEKKWNRIVPVMVGRANKNSEVIDAKTEEAIRRYLVTISNFHKE